MCLDCAGVYGLHMSPSRGALRATQNRRKKGTYFRTAFLAKTNENVRKKSSKRSPNGWVYFGGERPGALLGHLWGPSPFLNTENEPKVPPGAANYSKSDPKEAQKCKKWLQKCPWKPEWTQSELLWQFFVQKKCDNGKV